MIIIVIVLLLLPIAGCGGGVEEVSLDGNVTAPEIQATTEETGSEPGQDPEPASKEGTIKVDLLWQDNNQSILSHPPEGIVKIRIFVSSSDMETVIKDFSTIESPMSIENIPEGKNCDVTVKGLDITETALYMGNAHDVIITPDEATSLRITMRICFLDDFEDDRGWKIFEEIVGNNPVYGDGIGEVVISPDIVFNGKYSLLVWANKLEALRSNHVIAGKKLSDHGQAGKWLYHLYAYIPQDISNNGQTGPELSVQNTREIAPGKFRTYTAGIQYRRSEEDWKEWDWAVWHNATWQKFQTQKLTPGKWYYLMLEFDYANNRYVQFQIRGEDADLSLDMSSYIIGQEDKWKEEAFWISVESENLWSNGTEVFTQRIYYDNVELLPSGSSVPRNSSPNVITSPE